jgi:hypothetical protein
VALGSRNDLAPEKSPLSKVGIFNFRASISHINVF